MNCFQTLLFLACAVNTVNGQGWGWGGPPTTQSPTSSPTPKPFCVETCKDVALQPVCACGKDFTSTCHAKCAGYIDHEINEATCEETHCRKDGKNPCPNPDEQTCVTVWQRSVDNKCIGATYSCVMTSMLLTCPMRMQNEKGACLEAGGGTLYVPNKCYAEALGLEAKDTGCETQTIDDTVYEPQLFLNDQGSLNYYYNFSNATLMAEFGDVIVDDCNDVCAQNRTKLWERNPQSVTFDEFCLSFWNPCHVTCSQEKYADRLDSFWKSNPTITPGICKDPCASDSPFACDPDENCYPIRQQARCFPAFDKQAQCMLDNCPNWNSTDAPTDPVCVKVYAGIRVDNVYRGGGSVSAYTYRDACMATCEGFKSDDWIDGSCSDNAVKECEASCGTGGTPVCAEVQVQVQIEQGDQLTIEFEKQEQTISSSCMAECLGWKEYTEGQCVEEVVSIAEWTGYSSQTCADYAKGGGSNHEKYCFADRCNDKYECPGDVYTMSGCQACLECQDSPVCKKDEFQGKGDGSNDGSDCSVYAPGSKYHQNCDDKHLGLNGPYTGKTACEACPTECGASPVCKTDGFKGGDDKRTCSSYAGAAFKVYCGEVHTGPDPLFTGQTACGACSECSDSLVCQASSTEFVNELGKGCDYYTSDLTEYCFDVHRGAAASWRGKTACDACPVCQAAPICNAPDTGFVGFQWNTCSSYSEGGANHPYCYDDEHQDNAKDQSFKGQNACQACSNECGKQWKCKMESTGFYGYKGAQCAQYAENAPDSFYEYCAIDRAVGPDASLKGQTACVACPGSCGNKKACNQPTDVFIGYQMEWTCTEYEMPANLKYCDDKYTGPNVAQFGNTRACDKCPGCATAQVCNDNWSGAEGLCAAYNDKQRFCDHIYSGPKGAASQHHNKRGCDSCNECAGAEVCKSTTTWSYNGYTCSKYSNSTQGNYNKYCHKDKSNSDMPQAAEAKGTTACIGCKDECSSNSNC